MTNDKGAESGSPPKHKHGEATPFDRLVDFTRRIIAVPKSELSKKKPLAKKRQDQF